MSVESHLGPQFRRFSKELEKFGDASIELDAKLSPVPFGDAYRYFLLKIREHFNSDDYTRSLWTDCPLSIPGTGPDPHYCSSCHNVVFLVKRRSASL